MTGVKTVTENSKISVGTTAGLAAGLATGLGIILGIDPENLLRFFSDVVANQIAQAGFFFTMAAWIHSSRVKKEIAKNFSSVTDAINNVALALRNDLETHGKRLDNLSNRVDHLDKDLETFKLQILNTGESNA